jgi:hypothetical protein
MLAPAYTCGQGSRATAAALLMSLLFTRMIVLAGGSVLVMAFYTGT